MGAEALGLSTYAQINAMQAQMQQQQPYNYSQLQAAHSVYSGMAHPPDEWEQKRNRAMYEEYKRAAQRQTNPPVILTPPTPKQETTVANEKEILPDISLTRVLKWGVVLIIAMALGKKVWATVGKQVTERLEGAVKELL